MGEKITRREFLSLVKDSAKAIVASKLFPAPRIVASKLFPAPRLEVTKPNNEIQKTIKALMLESTSQFKKDRPRPPSIETETKDTRPPIQLTRETDLDVVNASVTYHKGCIYAASMLCDRWDNFPAKAHVQRVSDNLSSSPKIEDIGFPDLGPNTRVAALDIFESPLGIHAVELVCIHGDIIASRGFTFDGNSWKSEFDLGSTVTSVTRVYQAFVQPDGSWITNTHLQYIDKATQGVVQEDWLYKIKDRNTISSARLAPEKPAKYFQTTMKGQDQLMHVFIAPSSQPGMQHLFIEAISPNTFGRTSPLIEIPLDIRGISLNPAQCYGVFNPKSKNYDMVIAGSTDLGSAVAFAQFRPDVNNASNVNLLMLTNPSQEIVESSRITTDPTTGSSYIVYTCIERATQAEKTYILEPGSGTKTFIPDSSTKLVEARVVNMNEGPLLEKFDTQNPNLFVTGIGLFPDFAKTQQSGWQSR